MPLMKNKEKDIIKFLYNAECNAQEIVKITDQYPKLTVKEAYSLQHGLLAHKIYENGTKRIGIKLGLTSKEKQKMMGVNEAIYGYLHSDMIAYEWEPIEYSPLIHPKAEPEIAFLLGEDLQGEDVTARDVISATKYVAPALEIIDSRFKDFRFTLADVIADNCSSAKFIVGSRWVSPGAIDLGNIGMVLSKNGKVIATGSSAAVLGNPVTAITWAVHQLASKGEGLKKGDVVLSGAMSKAIAFNSNDSIVAQFNNLGSVSLYCE
ncbi:2-keto-4-pentenoate hydratase [Virgibacillus ihumii]|uniref:2-keto-4-pentenoate hydratase n=1 Tax=Virgibacillus ihumii TaxID=2686091 RepID=UPI00157D8CC5|nr:fumarylacetoacetate hydrolase family protein [Virgibacillus ihumii]